MDNIFNNVSEADDVVSSKEDAKKQHNKERKGMMQEMFMQALNSNPDMLNNLHTKSNSLMLTHSLGYSSKGNIIDNTPAEEKKRAKANNEDIKRDIKPVSQIVGYEFMNVGDEAISYTTEVYQQDENGVYVGSVVQRNLAPGETVALARPYVTMLLSIPEFSFRVANAMLVFKGCQTGSRKKIKEELSQMYMKFQPDKDGVTKAINDDEVKLSIDENEIVKPEYIETFGYLNNPKEASKGRKKKNGENITAQALAANFVQSLIKSQGSIE